MKQIKLILGLLFIVVLAGSCKKEEITPVEDAALPVLVTKIITTNVDGQKTTRLYAYDGQKIKNITETSDAGTTIFTYTYTGSDISKIVETVDGVVVKSQSFIHAAGKLLMWSENYETDSESCFYCETVATVDYNADGSQTVKYYDYYDTPDQILKKTIHVNVINSASIHELTGMDPDGNGQTILYGKNKPNPHKNIIGWNYLKLIDPQLYAEEVVTGFLDYENNEHVSGGQNSYQYNAANFPISCTYGVNTAGNVDEGSRVFYYNQ